MMANFTGVPSAGSAYRVVMSIFSPAAALRRNGSRSTVKPAAAGTTTAAVPRQTAHAFLTKSLRSGLGGSVGFTIVEMFLLLKSSWHVHCFSTVTFGGWAYEVQSRSITFLSGCPSLTMNRYLETNGLPGSIDQSPSWLGAKQKKGSLGCSRIGCGERKLEGWERIVTPVNWPFTIPPIWHQLPRVSLPFTRSFTPSDVRNAQFVVPFQFQFPRKPSPP